MHPVVQEDISGCGIAGVAALAGISYARAKEEASRVGISVRDSRLWSDTRCVRTLLSQYGIKVAPTEQPFVSWEDLPGVALLAIKWHLQRGTPAWHWVVFVRDTDASYVLDPKKTLKTNRRTDFGRMKPKWSIEVYG